MQGGVSGRRGSAEGFGPAAFPVTAGQDAGVESGPPGKLSGNRSTGVGTGAAPHAGKGYPASSSLKLLPADQFPDGGEEGLEAGGIRIAPRGNDIAGLAGGVTDHRTPRGAVEHCGVLIMALPLLGLQPVQLLKKCLPLPIGGLDDNRLGRLEFKEAPGGVVAEFPLVVGDLIALTESPADHHGHDIRFVNGRWLRFAGTERGEAQAEEGKQEEGFHGRERQVDFRGFAEVMSRNTMAANDFILIPD